MNIKKDLFKFIQGKIFLKDKTLIINVSLFWFFGFVFFYRAPCSNVSKNNSVFSFELFFEHHISKIGKLIQAQLIKGSTFISHVFTSPKNV